MQQSYLSNFQCHPLFSRQLQAEHPVSVIRHLSPWTSARRSWWKQRLIMSFRNATQARLQNVRRPLSYYQRARQEHKKKDRTTPLKALNISKSKRSLLKKWHRSVILCSRDECLSDWAANVFSLRFCSDIDEPVDTFLQHAAAEDFKTFLEWILDKYSEVLARDSFSNYWRVLKMYILDYCGRELNDGIKRDVTNVRALAANNRHSLIYYVVDSTRKSL